MGNGGPILLKDICPFENPKHYKVHFGPSNGRMQSLDGWVNG